MFVWILRSLRTGFWALPAAMTLGAAALAVVMISLDVQFAGALESSVVQPFLVTAESAGRILSVVAGSMITVTSLVLSTTLIALTLAATNIGPRLVERFMEDRVTQISLGVFVATFVYSLLVLRAVKGGDANPFIPYLAVNLALLMAILSFGWLIFFIYRISGSLQTDKVVAQTGADFVRAIGDFASQGGGVSDHAERGEFDSAEYGGWSHSTEIVADMTGYIRVINHSALYDFAAEHDMCIEMLLRPGHFVLPTTPLARLHFRDWELSRDAGKIVVDNVVVGESRTDAQDVELLVNMVVEVAARALSPGVNDFFSAISCIDHLCHGLSVVLEKGMPPNLFYDDVDQSLVRLALRPNGFGNLADAAFNPIRQFGATNVPVSLRLLEAFTLLCPCAQSDEDCAVIAKHAILVREAALGGAKQESDRDDIRQRYVACEEALRRS
jgi:uncharacterized membrane protein